MIDLNSPELSFRTAAQVKAYSTFFLGTNPLEIPVDITPAEEQDLELRRETSLIAQLDLFKRIDFSGANRSQQVEGTYYKLCKSHYTKPLSSEGASVASSRFNYKNNSFFKNRVIYLGRTKLGCEIELFHLEEQRENLRKKYIPGYYTPTAEDIVLPDYSLHEYEVSFDNILVLTSKSCADAIKIGLSAIQNEWFDLNYEYDIPSASQILGTIARVKGYKGILYKSVRYQLENNLVLFEENTGELDIVLKQTQAYIPSPEIIKIDAPLN